MDLDCIVSGVGLKNMIQVQFPEKEVLTVLSDQPSASNSKKYSEYTNGPDIFWAPEDVTSYVDLSDTVILVDTAKWQRAGIKTEQARELQGKGVPMIILDHHEGPPDVNTLNYIERNATSAAELVARMYLPYIDSRTSYLLALGIASDTNALQYLRRSNVTKAHLVFDELFQRSDVMGVEEIIEAAAPKFTRDEFELISKITLTRTRLPIDRDIVDVCYEPRGGIIDKKNMDAEGIAERVVANFLATGSDVAVFIKPVRLEGANLQKKRDNGYTGNTGDIIWEMKIRTDKLDIAAAIGMRMHRGGHNGAARAEYWPNELEQAEFRMNPDLIRQHALEEFVRIYKEERSKT